MSAHTLLKLAPAHLYFKSALERIRLFLSLLEVTALAVKTPLENVTH